MKSIIKINIFILLFLFSIGSTKIFAQKQWSQLKFKRFGVDQGLTVTTAFSIVQDENGFLWIATIDGLLRYDGYKFIHYKNNFNDSTSISDNTVSTLCKGPHNIIWVGTYSGGLNRLDASTGKFKRFQNIPGNKNSLSSNRVWSVFEDKYRKIWVGTDNGLDRIDLTTGKITRYFHEEGNAKSLCNNNILSIAQDKHGAIWIGTINGLSRAVLDKEGLVKEFINYKNNSCDSCSLSGNIVMSLFETKDGRMLIGTNDGLNTFNESTHKFLVKRFSAKSDSAVKPIYSYLNSYGNNAVRAIYEDKYHNVWLTTDHGLKILNLKTGEFITYQSEINNSSTLSADLLQGIFEDKSKNIWIGTMVGGLNKADLKPQKFSLIQTQNGNPFNLSKNNIRSIFVDSKNILWVGTMEGGLSRINPKTEKFERVQNKNFDASNIWAIYEDTKENMWFGASNGLFRCNRKTGEFRHFTFDKNNPESISNDIVRSFLEDSKGNLWVGTEGGLNKYDYSSETFTRFLHDAKNPKSLSNNTIWTLLETTNTLWIGTDNGLNKLVFDDRGNPFFFKHYFPSKENKNSISNRSVRSLWLDKDQILWIGTSNGLNKFDYKTETFTRFNEENGLSNSYIYGVLGDNKENLWISTNNGVARFNKKNSTFMNYDKLDGLQNNEFNTGAFFKSKFNRGGGEMFFGGPDGFNRFFPDSLSENHVPPPVVITTIKIFGSELKNDKQPYEITDITLRHDENVIEFEFAALDFTLPEKNKYLYMLEGFDKGWVKAGNRRFIDYTNLDPGKYKFKVRASNPDGTWNEKGKTINLTIIPPFWKTWWFRILSLVCLVFLVYAYFRHRLNRLRKVQEFLEEQVFIKTKELREEKETVDEQNKLIEKKNHNITSSIRYAKRIQDSILPTIEKLNDVVPESFIFFKPKDIVSGDFYWFTRQNGSTLVAAVDCTGHGVPGAFMSLIGNNLLNDIVKNKGLNDPAIILKQLHEEVVVALKKGEHESDTVDGMDITLCVVNNKTQMLEFSSTGRSLIFVRDNKIQKHKVGKQPLGLVTKKEAAFEKDCIQLQKNDTFYILTDGYCDQFGGPNDDKFLSSNFEKLLLTIQDKPMNEQSKIIESEMEKWRGEHPQIDDMLVIGMRY